MSRRPLRFLAAMLPGVAAIAPAAARGAPLPETATSHSVQTPSVLLEDEANAYVFPQLDAGSSPAFHSFGGSGVSASGSGARANVHGHALSYRHLRSVASNTAREDSLPMYQAAWAARVGPLRVGAAFAWAADGRREREDEHVGGPHVDDFTLRTRDFRTLGDRRGSVGIGWGNDAFALDLAAELAWDELDFRWRRVQQSLEGRYFRRVEEVDLRLDGNARAGVAGRLSSPLGGGLRVVGFGSFRDLAVDFRADTREVVEETGLIRGSTTQERDRDRGQTWRAGARVAGGSRIRWGAHVFRENVRSPWRYTPRRTDRRRTRLRLDSEELGFSVTFPARWDLEVRSGVVVRRTKSRETEEQRYSDRDAWAETRIVDSLSKSFAWGLSRSFGRFDLTGSAATDLSPSDLFVTLDLRVRL